MTGLSARDISKSFAAVQVLDRVSLVVSPGDRIGIVGPNGIGKSTLLRVLAGLEEPDSGRVVRSGSLAYLVQEPPVEGQSGGEAARRALGEVLREEPDVLLLDEPTNNLDFDGLRWLERSLLRSQAGIVLVSHDRAFLDRVVTRVVEFEGETRRVREYPGNWSDYAAARERARAEHERAYGEFVEERDRYTQLLSKRRSEARAGGGQADRRGTNALRGKVAQAKHHLASLEEVDKPWTAWNLQLTFADAPRANEIVSLRGAVVERGSFRVGPVDLELRYGDRLALVGPNGSGKTTLLGALTGELFLVAGTRSVGSGAVFGELEQGRDRFRGVLLDDFVGASGLQQAEARTLLAKFALGADDVLRTGPSLSPGERTRAALALFAARGVNCLILDEPTNHLDLEAIEELERALASYDGALIIVSHDRRFLEAVAVERTLRL
jgi:ATPase subunit of ABC transporter with duplicated ATPase domains